MNKICWDFPLLGTGNESGNNIAAITMFKGAGIMDGLAREVCQNSLDAKNKKLPDNVPVRVKFELFRFKKSDYQMFSEYEQYIDNSIDYWKESPLSTPEMMKFIQAIKASLNTDEIPVLVMSDFNTTGLNGVNASNSEKSFWNLLVNTEGISIKADKSSAGSYGIGKNAPFAYSSLNLVFYNTLATDGGRAFEGVARLATTRRVHMPSGELRKTQPIGKYLYLEDEFTGRPIIPSDGCNLSNHPAFQRNEGKEGTDVAVFGFKENEYENWESALTIALVKNFILAIYNSKLEVCIKSENKEYIINKTNLESILFEDFKEERELKYSKQIYKTLVNPDRKMDFKIAEDGDLTIYAKYSETYSQSLSRFRATGMLINTTTGDVLPHFSVVVIVNNVGEKELSETLKKAEPPQHTEWKAKNITDDRPLHNKAAKYLREISKAVGKILDEFDLVEQSEVIDGGLGNFLPGKNIDVPGAENTEGIVSSVLVQEIVRNDGRIIYDRNTQEATAATGSSSQGTAYKTGDKKRRKKKRKVIKPVDPNNPGKKKGVSAGQGKVKIVNPKITDQRTFYLAGNRYKLYIESPNDYDNVFVEFFAGRDDETSDKDALEISSAIMNNCNLLLSSKKIGPFKLNTGDNTIYFEFTNHEYMAVKPFFTREVNNEKQSN